MNLYVFLNGENITDKVISESIKINDNLNQRASTAFFSYYDLQQQPPAEFGIVRIERELFGTNDVLFAGTVLRKREINRFEGAAYRYECINEVIGLQGELIDRIYTNKTANEIATDLVKDFAPQYTATGVKHTEPAPEFVVNGETIDQALYELSQLFNLQYSVDEHRNIHMFALGDRGSPFKIEKNTVLRDKGLDMSSDFSQLANIVRVEGAYRLGDETTELYEIPAGTITVVLANRYHEAPTVSIDGVAQEVSIEFQEEDKAVVWNYNEKYVRFATSGRNRNIAITGVPEIEIDVERRNQESIDAYYKRGTKIAWRQLVSSEAEAVKRADAELLYYSEPILEGTFQTYRTGLRVGQTVEVETPYKDASGNKNYYRVMIQSIQTTFRSPNAAKPVFSVKVASYKLKDWQELSLIHI